ncbi:hypothetical protein [Tannerella forsythia]|uniref:hypothetical protein n=1 Tax=Tannerella forsythia TaxID=28112 RepID=UPI00241DC453|nr:hypothetical protein [Tannerella forsythia]
MDVRMHDNGYVRLTALRRDAMPFSPTLRIGLNYLALSGLFLQSAVSIQQSAEPTTKQINISTIQQLTASAGFTRAESPNYFSPIPQGWGIDIRTLFGGLKA